MKWDETSIKSLLDKNDEAVKRAIVRVHALQTADEQAGKQTRHTNGVGFSKFDAEFMSSLAEQIRLRGSLSPKQLAIGRNKIKRYWRQLVKLANEKQQAAEVPVVQQNASVEDTLGVCDCENYDGEDICRHCKSMGRVFTRPGESRFGAGDWS